MAESATHQFDAMPLLSDYDRLIPPEVKGDPFYRAILDLAREEKIRTVLEIGSSSGEGSTEAFVLGLRANPNRPMLFCIELSKPRFEALGDRYAADAFVKPYWVSSVPVEKFPSGEQATRLHNADHASRFVPPKRHHASAIRSCLARRQTRSLADADPRSEHPRFAKRKGKFHPVMFGAA